MRIARKWGRSEPEDLSVYAGHSQTNLEPGKEMIFEGNKKKVEPETLASNASSIG